MSRTRRRRALAIALILVVVDPLVFLFTGIAIGYQAWTWYTLLLFLGITAHTVLLRQLSRLRP